MGGIISQSIPLINVSCDKDRQWISEERIELSVYSPCHDIVTVAAGVCGYGLNRVDGKAAGRRKSELLRGGSDAV